MRRAGGDQHFGGDFESDVDGLDQAGRGGLSLLLQVDAVCFDFVGQDQPAPRQRAEHVAHRRVRTVQRGGRRERRARLDELVVGQRLELGAQLVVGGDERRLSA